MERALKIWITGEKVLLDSSNPAGWFSSDNWGDYIKQKNGKPVKMKRTSTFVKPLRRFTPQTWSNIFYRAAMIRASYDPKRTRTSRKRAISDAPHDADQVPESDSDGELDV